MVKNEIVTYKNILFSLADDLDNAGIATYSTQRIHESGVRCGSHVILAADKYFLPHCFISSFELFCFGRKKTLIDKVRDFGSLCALWFLDYHFNEREKEYS